MYLNIKQFLKKPCVAVDLGTAFTRLYSAEMGRISESPSYIYKDMDGDLSEEAASILPKRHKAPLRGGVIVDPSRALSLLRPLLGQAACVRRGLASLASAPTDTSEKERSLLYDALIGAGASHVAIIPEAWAAAVGAGMDVASPYAQAIVDIGDGVTDMAVIRDGRIIYASAVRSACADLRESIEAYVLDRHRALLLPSELQRLAAMAVSALGGGRMEEDVPAQGYFPIGNAAVKFTIPGRELAEAAAPVIRRMTGMVSSVIRSLPERTYCEILETGISLTGGGACVSGMDRLMASAAQMDVRIGPDPMRSVINGDVATLNYWMDRPAWWEKITWPSFSRLHHEAKS